MSEEEIEILMTKEIVGDVCSDVKDKKCYEILHKIILRGEGLERLREFSEEDKAIIKERLKEIGAGE